MSELNLEDHEVAGVYRKYLASAFTVATGLKSVFEHERPDALVLFNGRMAPTRVALEIAHLHKIHTLTEERGFAPGYMRLVENTHCLDPKPLYDLWTTWRDIPLRADEIESVRELLDNHKSGLGHEMTLFSAPVHGPDTIFEQLQLDQNKPIVAIFTSATDEAADQPEARGFFNNQAEWLEETVNAARSMPDVQFVVRAHPNTSGKRALGTNPVELEHIGQLRDLSPDNVRIVAPDADISSFDLILASTAGAVWHSSLGLEMAAMGKRVLRAGAYWLKNAEFMNIPRSGEPYKQSLLRMLEPETLPSQIDRTISAWRFAYCWFFRQSVPFPLVRQPDWARGEFSFETSEALAPGKDESLDRVCDAIMNRTQLFTTPGSPNETGGDIDAEYSAIRSWLES